MRRFLTLITVSGAVLAATAGTSTAAPPITDGATAAWTSETIPNTGSVCSVAAFATNVGTGPGRVTMTLWYGNTTPAVAATPKDTFGPVTVHAGDGVGYFFDVPNKAAWRIRVRGTTSGDPYVANYTGSYYDRGCTFNG